MMVFPPYPAPSIARSALPNAPVRDDVVPAVRDHERWVPRRGWRRFRLHRPAWPRLA